MLSTACSARLENWKVLFCLCLLFFADTAGAIAAKAIVDAAAVVAGARSAAVSDNGSRFIGKRTDISKKPPGMNRVVAAEAERRALRKDVKRLRKESRRLSAESDAARRDINREVLKLNVYFDAVRYGVCSTHFPAERDLLSCFPGARSSSLPGTLRTTSVRPTAAAGWTPRAESLWPPWLGRTSSPSTQTRCLSTARLHVLCGNNGSMYCLAIQVKGSDGLVLLKHNGATIAGSFDTDNFKHNTLGQTSLANLRFSRTVGCERRVLHVFLRQGGRQGLDGNTLRRRQVQRQPVRPLCRNPHRSGRQRRRGQ